MFRIFMFLGVNILITTVIGLLIKVTGFENWLYQFNIGSPQVLVSCFVWGFGGALVSLFLSKTMAKSTMGVQVLHQNDPEYGELVLKVYVLARKAGLKKMPEVGIYHSNEVNAFATGPSKNNALVAFSTGIIEKMDDDALEGVAAHEISHIVNGDMVTMTIITGLVNAFVLVFSRILARIISNFGRSNDEEEEYSNYQSTGGMEYFIAMIIQLILTFLAMPLTAWFSRFREFKADKGSAVLAGREKMIKALSILQGNVKNIDTKNGEFSSLKI